MNHNTPTNIGSSDNSYIDRNIKDLSNIINLAKPQKSDFVNFKSQIYQKILQKLILLKRIFLLPRPRKRLITYIKLLLRLRFLGISIQSTIFVYKLMY